MRRHYLLLCLAQLTRPLWAQSTTSTEESASSTTTSSTAAATHTISVGAGGNHKMSPNTTTANVGDTIVFEFFPTNHSVIRSEYAGADNCPDGGCNPCVPYELYYPEDEDKAFFSGNREVSSYADTQTWSLTVNDTDPIWFYCNALSSCSPNAMVGVINPGTNQTIDKQISAAKHSAYQLAPGEDWPAEGSSSSSSDDDSSSSKHKNSIHLSGGVIAGIVVGIVVFLGLCAALAFFIGRSRAYGKIFKNGSSGAGSQPAMSEAGYPTASHVPGPGAENPWFQQQQLMSAPDRMGSPPLPSPPLSSPPIGFPGAPVDNKHMSVASFNPQQRWSDSTGVSNFQRAASPVPLEGGGTFVGYNRLTGAPEFAAEVMGDQTMVATPPVEGAAAPEKKDDAKANSPVEMDAREGAHF
ncbi:uncharacterized protein K452DRAFT_312405 [Aplosporella prunicola CBS 121167]|uniref:Extracellular serine-rich protein n=1 Tax=Aplosporella prunicola CBS 121167 TaxID=1176127 RepID=A0A6A6B053_9PEZI|nr:uncharacterized protein K452DRAFT_312405 [Aplosporella prunicola CBS 121167]KAF2137400.1 hypothetical protein K452DRAFT_312405 [Aplosporella prunicola CBS 121167]